MARKPRKLTATSHPNKFPTDRHISSKGQIDFILKDEDVMEALTSLVGEKKTYMQYGGISVLVAEACGLDRDTVTAVLKTFILVATSLLSRGIEVGLGGLGDLMWTQSLSSGRRFLKFVPSRILVRTLGSSRQILTPGYAPKKGGGK